MKNVFKSMPCVVRNIVGAPELLIFQHPHAGIQIPKGTVEPGETIASAAWRELEEETGVTAVRLLRPIGQWARVCGAGPDEARPLEKHLWELFLFEPTADLGNAWEHTITALGIEQGMRVQCHWLPLAAKSLARLNPVFQDAFKMVMAA